MVDLSKDGVYGSVTGTVGRVFQAKNGAAFEVGVVPYGSQYADKWTVWGDLGVSEGDRVRVAGFLEVRREKYTKDGVEQVAIKRSVNRPKLDGRESAAPAAVSSAPAWNTPTDEVPF